MTPACGTAAPEPGWHWRDPGKCPSSPCEPSRAMNSLVGDSERHLRHDTAALGSREGPCPQQSLRDILAVLEGHLKPSCPASTPAVAVLPYLGLLMARAGFCAEGVGHSWPLCPWGCPLQAPRAWQGLAAPNPRVCPAVGWGEEKFPSCSFGLSILGRRVSGGSLPCRCLPEQGALLRMSLAALPCPWGAGWEEAAEGA